MTSLFDVLVTHTCFFVSGDLASQRALLDDRGELPRVQELRQGQLGSSNQ